MAIEAPHETDERLSDGEDQSLSQTIARLRLSPGVPACRAPQRIQVLDVGGLYSEGMATDPMQYGEQAGNKRIYVQRIRVNYPRAGTIVNAYIDRIYPCRAGEAPEEILERRHTFRVAVNQYVPDHTSIVPTGLNIHHQNVRSSYDAQGIESLEAEGFLYRPEGTVGQPPEETLRDVASTIDELVGLGFLSYED